MCCWFSCQYTSGITGQSLVAVTDMVGYQSNVEATRLFDSVADRCNCHCVLMFPFIILSLLLSNIPMMLVVQCTGAATGQCIVTTGVCMHVPPV